MTTVEISPPGTNLQTKPPLVTVVIQRSSVTVSLVKWSDVRGQLHHFTVTCASSRLCENNFLSFEHVLMREHLECESDKTGNVCVQHTSVRCE